jgi:hypothetical protein
VPIRPRGPLVHDDARSVIRNRRLRELIVRVSADLVSSSPLPAELSVQPKPAAALHVAARSTGRDMEEQG